MKRDEKPDDDGVLCTKKNCSLCRFVNRHSVPAESGEPPAPKPVQEEPKR